VFPRGAIFDADLSKVEKAKPEDVVEFVDHSWYTVDSGRKNPAEGKTEIKFTRYDTEDKYSWVKAPRFKGKPMEVGPLARMLIAYVVGRKKVKKLIDDALAALGQAGKLEILLSVLGRTAARALEAKLIADEMVKWFEELAENLKKGQVKVFTSYEVPGKAEGVGLWEAPRGALAHWNRIEKKRIAHYQVVTPSAWNFSPRDADDVRGPVEEALIGTPVINPAQPLEVLRTVHSFDP
jgi:[NiFe] hydrogenase large subunit